MRAEDRTRLGLGLVLALVACGGDGSPTTSAAMSASGAGTASDGGSTSTSSAASDTDATADGSGTGVGACGDIADDDVGPLVTLTIVNTRAEGVWLPLADVCPFSVPYTLTGPDGAPVPWVGPDCGTCREYAEGHCECPGAPCPTDVLLYLESGAMMLGAWSGGQFVDDTLPEACPGIEPCGASCERAVQSPPGRYAIELLAGPTASGCEVDPCACAPTDGRCSVFDARAVVDDPRPYSATFEFPGTTMVEVAID